jgi:hypothetical protein
MSSFRPPLSSKNGATSAQLVVVHMMTGQLMRVAGSLVVLDVVGVYVYCLRVKGVHPPSHPWSGITLILLAIAVMLNRGSVQGRLAWGLSGGTLLVAVLWTVAAVLSSRTGLHH